jgi:hypothetical protein
VTTLSLSPGSHPQRRAALAAHALREALSTVGLLDDFPECHGAVDGERAIVHLGDIDAAAAVALAKRLTRSPRRKRPAKDECADATGDGA